MKRTLGILASLLLALNPADAAVLGQWSFNSPIPDGAVGTGTNTPSAGGGTAALVGGATATFVTGDTKHDPAGSTDNSAWSTAHYPPATTSNKTAGVRFRVATTGYENIVVSWYQKNSNTASRYLRCQYTLDGNTFYDAAVIVATNTTFFTNQTVDLSAVPGVKNNPAFGFQLVAEFESTATGAGADDYVATGSASTYGTTGAIHYDLVTVSGTEPDNGNTPPYVFSSIGAQAVRAGQSTGPLPFLVLDAESPASSLQLSGASSDAMAVPAGNIVFGGSDANRTVSVTGGSQAASQGGAATVTVWVSDPGGKSNSTRFAVTVLPSDLPPFISAIPHTNTLWGTATPPLAFTVGDAETAAADLTLSGSSGNPGLVPNGSIVFGGSGSNRTVRVTPAAGQTGATPITVTVRDGAKTSSAVFSVMARDSAAVLLDEPFTYPNGSVVTNSGFLWTTRSGPAGQCQVVGGALQVTAAQSEDVVAPLIGGPYEEDSPAVLYAAFRARFLALPKAAPDCFAHFANGSTMRGRVYAGTTNAAPGMFRLSVANGSANPTELARDLSPNTPLRVVTRYDVQSATTTLWVDPASESDPGLTARDVQAPNRIASYGFRQDTDIGTVLVDDLKVGLSFAAVVPGAAPGGPWLALERTGSSAVLRWTDPAFALQAAPSVKGTFTNVPGATSPFTNPLVGGARFFRLKGN